MEKTVICNKLDDQCPEQCFHAKPHEYEHPFCKKMRCDDFAKTCVCTEIVAKID